MARQRVDPRHRRRVAQACDGCKRRKEKCNGALPCDQCKSRRLGSACCYTKQNRGIVREVDTGAAPNNSQVPVSITPRPFKPMEPSGHGTKQDEGGLASPLSNPESSRMLRDAKGKYIYVGESASLSFLQTVRRAAVAAIGPCPFANDPLTHLAIENTPPLRFENGREVLLDMPAARSLTDQFFVATSGTLDLFDPPWLTSEICAWVEHPSQQSESKSAIIYLVLAIGAQGRALDESDERVAEQCFAYGRKLVMLTLMDDPSLSTIQAFALITYYMMAACRHNAAFINLGVAVRAAYTLGIHLHETNNAFGGEEGISRERAWKSLRVCDLFLSASLGRPPATAEVFCNIPWSTPEQICGTGNPDTDCQITSAMFSICNVIERILVEVYSKKAITFELAKSISKEHRQWTEALPQMLKLDGLEESDLACWSVIVAKHGSRIVMMAYYYSIVLLTRPFLTCRVSSRRGGHPRRDDASSASELATYADACVDSATRCIDMAYEDVFDKDATKRQPFVINSVFISALCLGLAHFGDYDQQRWPLGDSVDRAIAILTHLGRLNPQSASHAEICRLLKDATACYVSSRDDTLLWAQRLSVRNVFGNLQTPASSGDVSQRTLSADGLLTPSQSGVDSACDEDVLETTSPPLDAIMLQQEAIFPTSEVWPGHMARALRVHDLDYPDLAIMPHQDINTHVPYFEHDVPLFSLTNDFTPPAFF